MKAKAARMCVEKGSRNFHLDADDPQTPQSMGELTTGGTQGGGGEGGKDEL